jgi:hypothetical protein
VKKLLLMSVMCLLVAAVIVVYRSTAQVQYTPKAQFCAILSNGLCSLVPAYIGPDPRLKKGFGYSGLFVPLPTSAASDVQTPFDNMAWQMFISLNWAASAVKQPAAKGLTVAGPRVFQTYRKVSALFGNSPVTASCSNPTGLPVFNIGSNGNGTPMPNNEEYFQASTNLPLIDINGNWTLYERRVNDVEANYLLAPNGQSSQTLTTMTGQTNFIASNPGGAKFTASSTSPIGKNGSIEIKASWRIINQSAGDDPSRYYIQTAILAVPGDLVSGGNQICSTVKLGLVGMHIIQRNPVDPKNGVLLPQWIWATFEHVDNAPMAQAPCSVDAAGCGANAWLNQASCGAAAPAGTTRYSFYNQTSGPQGTNIAPVSSAATGGGFAWNSTTPYAQGATTSATAMPQATRCWSIYPTTAQVNTQWRNALAAVKTPFQNYILIGTQWGGDVEPPQKANHLPDNAVPAMLSNTTLETYIQNYTTSTNNGGPGSCIGCHSGAVLAAGTSPPQADFSLGSLSEFGVRWPARGPRHGIRAGVVVARHRFGFATRDHSVLYKHD